MGKEERVTGHGGSDLSTAAGRPRPRVWAGEVSSGAGGGSLGKDRGFTVVFLVKTQHRLTTTPYTGSETEGQALAWETPSSELILNQLANGTEWPWRRPERL